MTIKTKRIIHNIFFDKDSAECSLTSGSQGGPASGMTTILLKTRDSEKELSKGRQPLETDLSDQERGYLAYIEEEFVPLQKQKDDTTPASSIQSDVGAEPDQTMTKGNEMSAEKTATLEAQVLSLRKSLVKRDLDKYKFENQDDIASIMVGLDDTQSESLVKAFDSMLSTTLTKSVADQAAEDLEKNVDSEVGAEGEAEFDKSNQEPTQVELIKAAIAAKREQV